MEKSVRLEVDGEDVVGVLHEGGENTPLAIICHRHTGNKVNNYDFFPKAARKLASKGFSVFRFDFRGSGDSEGLFEDQTHTSMLKDLDKAINHFEDRYSSINLIGHSQGFYVSLLKASDDDRINSIISWNGRVSDLEDFVGDPWKEEVERRGHYWLWGYKVTEKYFKDAERYSSREAVEGLDAPAGLIYGTADQTVPPSEGVKVRDNSDSETEMEIIEGLDHNVSGAEIQEKVVNQTAEWLNRWS